MGLRDVTYSAACSIKGTFDQAISFAHHRAGISDFPKRTASLAPIMDTDQLADIPTSPMHRVVADSPVARELERARAPVEFKRRVVP
jgi:hypothetical protein